MPVKMSKKRDHIYAYLAVDSNGVETTMALHIDNTWFPMIVGDLNILEQAEHTIIQQIKHDKKSVILVEYSSRKTLKVIHENK